MRPQDGQDLAGQARRRRVKRPARVPACTLDEGLDIGLAMLEEVFRYVHTWRFRPGCPTWNSKAVSAGHAD